MSKPEGPYRDYVEITENSGDDTVDQLVGLGIRLEQAKGYVSPLRTAKNIKGAESKSSFRANYFSFNS